MTVECNPYNLLHCLPPGPRPPKQIYCLVEIPRGGSNKYEYDKKLSVFTLDRALYSSIFYPTEYGFIPQTWSEEDKDPLDIMVLSTFSTFPGCLIQARPIGLLKIKDSGEEDDKIIAVASDDPRFRNVQDLADLEPHFKKEVENFWETYAKLQPEKEITIGSWHSAGPAQDLIEKAIAAYRKEFDHLLPKN